MCYTDAGMLNESDENLAVLYLAGDENALQVLIHRHMTGIYNFAAQFVGYGQNAEDVAQEAFIKTWKNLKKFDPHKKFKPWLYRIARNSAIDYLRQRKITVPLISAYNDEEKNNEAYLTDSAPLPLELAMTAETKLAVQKLIKSLPEIYSTVLNLYYLEEFSLSEIAGILSEPVDTVKSKHRRALIKLRNLISQDASLIPK